MKLAALIFGTILAAGCAAPAGDGVGASPDLPRQKAHHDSPAHPPMMSKARVEGAIERAYLKRSHLTARVSCPSGIVAEPGRAYQCMAHFQDATRIVVEVTIQNARGDIVWRTIGNAS